MISNTLLAFSVSADAMAAAACKGSLVKPRFKNAMQLSFVFSFVETCAILLGWIIGSFANDFIFAIDHWIAFSILSIIGFKMIYGSLQDSSSQDINPSKLRFIVLTAIGTSVDSIAVGITLGIINVKIWVVALLVAVVTFAMSSIGLIAGYYIGKKVGKLSGMVGGVILCMIGVKILLEHISW